MTKWKKSKQNMFIDINTMTVMNEVDALRNSQWSLKMTYLRHITIIRHTTIESWRMDRDSIRNAFKKISKL